MTRYDHTYKNSVPNMVQMVRDYETDILDKIMHYNQQESKSFIALKVKGHYKTTLDVIETLIDLNILEIKKGKLKIKSNDVQQVHEEFQSVLKEFKEGINYSIPRLRKISKETKKPIFWFTIEKLRPTSEPARMDHINKKARVEVLELLMYAVRGLVSSSFMLYQRILLDQVPKSEKKLLNEDIKASVDAIKDVKDKLLKIAGKKNKQVLESYWFQMTAGLRI